MVEIVATIAEAGATEFISEVALESTRAEISSGASSLSEVTSAIENGVSYEEFSQQAENALADSQVAEGMRGAISEVEEPPTAREVAETPELQQELHEYIKENSPCSGEVNEQIATKEELDYYLENGYEEVDINGKKILVSENLDLEQKDEDGKTNIERMEEGKPPLDKNRESYNMHHIGQNSDGPFSLIPNCDHKSMSGQLHDSTKSSEIDRQKFQMEKKEIFKGLAEIYK